MSSGLRDVESAAGGGEKIGGVRFQDTPTIVGGSSAKVNQMDKAPSGFAKLEQRYDRAKQMSRDFLSRTTNVSYLLISISIIVVILLLIIVGLSAGLGPKRSCPKHLAQSSKEALDEDDSQQVIPYEPNKPWTYFRLPRHVVPKHYDITLSPHFYTEEEKTFDGNITIEATLLSPARLIILHALDLNIHSTTVSYLIPPQDSGASTPPAMPAIRRTFFFEPYQYYVIDFKSRLKGNTDIEIKMTFSGKLSSATEGFYKAFFREPTTGKKLYVAMTQFEPLDARRMFPCFDEPNMKAHFTISVRHRSDFKALSNMPEAAVVPVDTDGAMVVTRFQRTPVPMSTYLVSLVVGKYASLPSVTTADSQIPISVYAPEYALEQTRYALEMSARLTDWLQRYFAARYPLPKIDFVVLPEFRWTAMENWGLITFREDALLVTNETTEVDRDHVVMVLAHELAHQWFGNLVTMDWWDDLWLNEGFASYMEFPASISVGRVVDSEEYYDFLGAITEDCYASSRPIRFLEIRSRNDIDSAFDTITYLKGSTIIRMLVNAMGPAKFKHGIQEYMQQYQYKNARTSDLWGSLSKEYSSGLNLTHAMTSWVEQKGFPLVTVELGAGGEELVVRQEPFVLPQWHPDKWDGTMPDTKVPMWSIPLTIQEPNGEPRTEWFLPNKNYHKIRLSQGARPEETKVNFNQTAFIRVNYPPAMWERFGDKLAQDINAFTPIDRSGLVDDSLELAKAGLLNYDIAFRTIRFLAKETHPLVWDTFVTQATFLNQMLWDSPQHAKFKGWLSATIKSARQKALQSIQSTSAQMSAQNPNYKRILSVLAEASLRFDPGTDAPCYANTYYKDRKWERPANVELRRAAFIAYLQTNDTEEGLNELLQVAKQSRLKQVQKQVLFAIARTNHFSLLARELEKLFSDEMTVTDFLSLANYALNSNMHRAFMWDWARDNFELLKPYYGGPTIKFMTWFVNIAKYFNTPTKYYEFDTFAMRTVRDFGAGRRARRLVEDQMRRNIYWRSNLKKQLENYLAELQIPTVTPSTIC